MKQKSVAVVGAAETTDLGVIPGMSQIQLHADAALNAMKDCGLKPEGHRRHRHRRRNAGTLAHYLGITPTWADGTAVGGCSFMLHVRHAAAAINEGLCKTVLITHGESGKSRVGVTPRPPVSRQPRRPVRGAVRRLRAADDVHDPGAALPEKLRHHGGAARDGRRRAARVGGEEPARHLQEPDHGRRRAELAHDRLSVPHPHVLPRHRRRRRAHPHQRRARQGLPDQARLHPRHRRERRNPR